MKAIIQPLGLGVLSFIGVALVFWFVAGIVLVPISDLFLAWLPAIVILPSTFTGGYVAAKNTNSNFQSHKLFMGGSVGALASILIIIFGTATDQFLFVIMLGGCFIAIAVLGAYMASRSTNDSNQALKKDAKTTALRS